MTDPEDGWERGSGDEEQSEEGDDEVQVVEESGSLTSATTILRLPERNEEDTTWTRDDDSKSTSGKHKLTVEVMTRVRKQKELLWKEVAKFQEETKWHVWVSKESCKQGNRLILWGV